MSCTIYLIRHCEALGNKTGTFQGSIDSDITEIGAKQLECLTERFKNIHIDKIYSSPLKRAHKTALAVSAATNIPVITETGLSEIDGGNIEGMTYADIYKKYPYLEYDWTFAPYNFAPPNGENMRDAYKRITDTVLRLVRENDGKQIAIASHGGVIRCLLCFLMCNDILKLNDVIWSDNTSVTKINFKNDMSAEFEYLNSTVHLPAEYLPQGSRIASYIKVEDK